MEKNRKLENELTELKVQHEAVSQEYETLKTRHEVSDRQLSSQMELIQRLEEDITRLNQSSGTVNGYNTQGAGNGYFTPGSNGPSTGYQLPTSPPFGQLAFSGEVVGGVTLGPVLPNTPRAPGFPSSASLSLEASTPTATSSSAEHSILPIVTSQRDRFRQRNSELEEQLRQQSEQISNLRNETRTLQQDNVKLYEKIKYMQSYRGGDDSSGSGVGAGYLGSAAPSATVDFSSPFRSSGMTGRPTGGQYKKNDGDEIQMQGVDPTDRYRNIYEESMNPFEAFHKKVKSICPASTFYFSIFSSSIFLGRIVHIFVLYLLFWLESPVSEPFRLFIFFCWYDMSRALPDLCASFILWYIVGGEPSIQQHDPSRQGDADDEPPGAD